MGGKVTRVTVIDLSLSLAYCAKNKHGQSVLLPQPWLQCAPFAIGSFVRVKSARGMRALRAFATDDEETEESELASDRESHAEGMAFLEDKFQHHSEVLDNIKGEDGDVPVDE
eukprot:459728-Amphidinium_carterae.1